jgi:transmembrane sensor
LQTNQQLKELLVSHIRGTISEKDREALFVSLADDQLAEQWKDLIKELSSEMKITAPYNQAEWDPLIQEILLKKENIDTATPIHRIHLLRRSWFRYAAAAVFIIAIGITAIVVSSRWGGTGADQQSLANSNKQLPADALPGKNGAVLTLADGSQVLLDSLGNGVVTTQGKTTVLIRNGQLVYNATSKESEVLYNTMTTPKGRQYQLVLPDGSQVWLNAASSITYPTAFAGNDRTVTITGEAYFEVAKDKTKPFHVMTGDMDVEVLGTHFNINSYSDEESIRTTLLEGSVKVTKSDQSALLKPGQQAIAANDHGISINSNIDVDQVMAWRNGRFQFNRTPLPEVMRQLSRWYDMEVEYVKDPPNVVFAGEMGRDLNLSQVLKGLSKMEVNFKIEGKKLIVMP